MQLGIHYNNILQSVHNDNNICITNASHTKILLQIDRTVVDNLFLIHSGKKRKWFRYLECTTHDKAFTLEPPRCTCHKQNFLKLLVVEKIVK